MDHEYFPGRPIKRVVQKVENRREAEPGKIEYLIKWDNRGKSHNTWETLESVGKANFDVVQQWETEYQHGLHVKRGRGRPPKNPNPIAAPTLKSLPPKELVEPCPATPGPSTPSTTKPALDRPRLMSFFASDSGFVWTEISGFVFRESTDPSKFLSYLTAEDMFQSPQPRGALEVPYGYLNAGPAEIPSMDLKLVMKPVITSDKAGDDFGDWINAQGLRFLIAMSEATIYHLARFFFVRFFVENNMPVPTRALEVNNLNLYAGNMVVLPYDMTLYEVYVTYWNISRPIEIQYGIRGTP